MTAKKRELDLPEAIVYAADVLASIGRATEVLDHALGANRYAFDTTAINMKNDMARMREALSQELRHLFMQMQQMMSAVGPEEGPDSRYTVLLLTCGPNKIQVIKCVREHTFLGLKEAKDLCDMAPSTVMANIDKLKAEHVASRLREVGAAIIVRVTGPADPPAPTVTTP